MVDALEILLSPVGFTITVITLVLTILSALLLGPVWNLAIVA